MSQIYTITLNPAVDRELTVPVINYNQVLRSKTQNVDFGGKGFNVSRMLKALGADSTSLGFVGGKSGELLKDGLRSLGIQTDFVWISGETRTNISIKSHENDHYIKVNEPGPTITKEEQEALVEKISQLCQSGDWWIIAGSLPPGIPTDYYAQLINILQSKNAKVVFDASGKPFTTGCLAQPYLVKPNDIELHEMTGLPVDTTDQIIKAANKLQEMGIEITVVSLGDKGALLLSQNENWLAKSPPIQEKNPIGAGDSLVGGMVYALSKGYPLSEALCWGVASGAAAASLSGTAVGSYEYVENLKQQTETQRLAP
jgi:1-phosphofructokinase family hexose kinase